MISLSSSIIRVWNGAGICLRLFVRINGSEHVFREIMGRDLRGCREDTHKLLEWPERLAMLKLDVHGLEIGKVGSEGCKVVRIVPGPRRTAFVVVSQDPAESLDVCMRAGPSEVCILNADAELLLIVSGLVTRLPESA